MFLPGDWVVQAVAFRRTDTNVIDWLRPNTAVRWQTYNVRDVDTVGVELGVSRDLPRDGFVRVEFTGLDVSAPAVTQLSKYALDYAPRSFVATAVLPRFGRVRIAPRLDVSRTGAGRARSRTVRGRQSQDYVLLDTRLSRAPVVAARADGGWHRISSTWSIRRSRAWRCRARRSPSCS